MPASDGLTFLLNEYGRPFASAAVFGNKFADWCRQAGLQGVECEDGRVRSYRAHGLRKAACVALAHAGCTGPEIMAVSGHSSLAQVAGLHRSSRADPHGGRRARQTGGHKVNVHLSNLLSEVSNLRGNACKQRRSVSWWRPWLDSNQRPQLRPPHLIVLY